MNKLAKTNKPEHLQYMFTKDDGSHVMQDLDTYEISVIKGKKRILRFFPTSKEVVKKHLGKDYEKYEPND